MEYCEECMKNDIWKAAQEHHIVHRSKAPYMKHIPINFKYLCLDHHTGRNGVHHHPEVDRQYKEELQLKLNLLFTKEYYNHTELKNLLKCSDNSVKALTKTLMRYKEGWKREDLIIHMLGDENYI